MWLDIKVGIAPQQTLPVLSVSNFLLHHTVRGGLPSHRQLHFNTLPHVSAFHPTTATEQRLKETPWLILMYSAVFLYQNRVSSEGKKHVWVVTSVNHIKVHCFP